MPVNFDFNDLYAFRALMEYGSFRLGELSSAVAVGPSRRIESWRRRWATGCSIAPPGGDPHAGQNFAERSEQLLAHVETVLADISQSARRAPGW
ncbi:LysR family transcriptional regulator [Klebsiella pneumoniae]|uniref:LysR family transcriptional regulator n=1 Tax=Klebsiella pneumoniae TaxID=573 RepID=A0A939NTK8_KLEPN|nr:LysR family transcriptional regulator [Klebsiella pneumoniae]